MASRRKNKDKPDTLDTTNVSTADVTEAILPGAVPTEEDGGVAGGGSGVDLDEAQVRRIGAIDADSAALNKRRADVMTRKRAGEKNVRWNDTNGLVKYDGILQLWGSAGLLAYVSRVEPGPTVDFPPMPCGALRNGQQLYDAIMRTIHRVSPAATYFVRCREGTLERGSFNLNLPDTTPLQQPAAGLQAPWMMQQPPVPYGYPYPPPGYAPFGAPPAYPGYPPPQPPPAYDPYLQGQAQAAQQPPPAAAAPAAAAPAAPAPAAPAPPPAPIAQQMQPQMQPPYGQPMQSPYGQPMMQPMQPYMQPPPPPPTADPAAQAWMGTMYQMLQDLKQRIDQSTQGTQRAEMDRLFSMIEEIKRGGATAPSMAMLQAQVDSLARQAAQPPAAAPAALAPAAQPPPGFMGAPATPGVGSAPGFGPFGMPNPYAALSGLPRPPGYPEHLPWPPNPWANPWGVATPPPAAAAQPPPPPPAPDPVTADPLESVRRSVEMVGTLATLMDRVRGVAPAVSEQTATAAPLAPTRPAAIETMRVGEVDVAIKPETGDISWLHTLVGVAPKAFSFLEKFSTEAAKTIRSHDAAQAVQSGRMPVQYVPMQQPHPQYAAPPPVWPPQQQFQPPPPPPPQPQQHAAPVSHVQPAPPRPAPAPAAPAPAPAPAPAAPPAAAPVSAVAAVTSPTAGMNAPPPPPPTTVNGTDEGIKRLFG